MHHLNFLGDHGDITKFRTWEKLVDVAATHELRIFQNTYRNEIFDPQLNITMSVEWLVDTTLQVEPDRLIIPVFDAGMSARGRIDAGFQPSADGLTAPMDWVHLAISGGISRDLLSTADPDRLGELLFADSKVSDVMQMCDVLGGLLRSYSRVEQEANVTPFVEQQAAIVTPLVDSGLAVANVVSWTSDA